MLILLIIYLIYLFIKHKTLFVISLIIILLYTSIFLIKEHIYKSNDLFVGTIIYVDTSTYIANNKEFKTYKYLVKNYKFSYYVYSENEYKVGDVIKFNGRKEEYYVHYPGQFNYNSYLHYKNIKGVINDSNIIKIKHRFTLYSLNNNVKNYIDSKFKINEKGYLKTFIIGNKDDLNMDDINSLGISHLFVISGLHINIIILVITKILGMFKINKKIQDIIVLILSCMYLVLTSFMISLIRVFVSLIIRFILKRLTRLDVISMNALIVCLVNPYLIYNISFILTYSISFFIICYKPLINNEKLTKHKILNNVVSIIVLTIHIQLFSLPITISINPDFNLLSFLLNPLFIFYVTYIFLPLSFITFILPFIAPIYSVCINIFQFLASNLAKITIFTIPLGNIHIVFKIIYFVVYYVSLVSLYKKKYKVLTLFLLTLLIWYSRGIFHLNTNIYFFDLPVGESTLIYTKNMNTTLLIDSGDVNGSVLSDILKTIGVRRIDYLIISHSDSDHIGGSFDLVKKIKVNTLICSVYEKNYKINTLSKSVKNIIYLKAGDVLNKKEFKINVISPKKDYKNINDNSLVFILDISNKSFMFTGDIEEVTEKDLLKENIDIDFLKVAHHGSITSSSVSFLNSINYKLAIVMSGYNNKFNFPNRSVMDRFHDVLITYDLGTINLKIKRKGCKIKLLKENWLKKQ